MDGSRKTEAASPNCRETASEELFDAIKKLRSDGIQSPDLRLPEPLLKVLKLEPDSPFARHHVSKALLSCAACLEEGTRSAFLFSAGFSKDITGSPGERVNRSAAVLKMGVAPCTATSRRPPTRSPTCCSPATTPPRWRTSTSSRREPTAGWTFATTLPPS